MGMAEILLGIDAGTTGFKAALFTTAGEMLNVACADYALETPGPDMVEFPADEYFQALCSLTKKLLAESGVANTDIDSLAISSQGETLICLDDEGRPLMNAIVWLDNRSSRQANALRERFGVREVYERTGQADMLPTWPATKILWLRENKPEIFERTRKFLLLEDYLIWRLTGVFAGEPNLYCSSALFDIHKNAWWPEMLNALGIDKTRLPSIVPCASGIGRITDEAARLTGLTTKTLVVAGALDQTCNCIGAGLTKPGAVAETTGSCLAVSANLDHFVPYDERIPTTCQNHAVPGRYVLLLWSQTAGMVFKWFANGFYDAGSTGLDDAFERMNRDAAEVTAGCDGLIMLPHLMGAMNPEYDLNAKGVFYGVGLRHEKKHFTRAIMEAVAYMLRRNLSQIEQTGQPFTDVYSMGGGARSPLWLQIKADATGKTFHPLAVSESACRGAAVLAGVGAGLYRDIDAGAESLLQTRGAYPPDAGKKPVYDQNFEDYVSLYEALKAWAR